MKSVSTSKARGFRSQQHAGKADHAGSPAAASDCPREQMIAEAAYYRAEQRGFAPGNEMSDWLQAEADVEGCLTSSQ